MGGGDFGSNGSVYWKVTHTVPDAGVTEVGAYSGKDPIRYDDIGKGGRHEGTYQLKLRFPDDATAWKALAQAFATVEDGVATVHVKKTSPARDTPTANPPWEIRIDW